VTPCSFYPGYESEFVLEILGDPEAKRNITLAPIDHSEYFKSLGLPTEEPIAVDQGSETQEREKVREEGKGKESEREQERIENKQVSIPVIEPPQQEIPAPQQPPTPPVVAEPKPTTPEPLPATTATPTATTTATTATCPCCGSVFNLATSEVVKAATKEVRHEAVKAPEAPKAPPPQPKPAPAAPSAPTPPPPTLQSGGGGGVAGMSFIQKIAYGVNQLKSVAERKVPAVPKVLGTDWAVPFNIEKIVARRTAMEASDDEDDEDQDWTEEDYMK